MNIHVLSGIRTNDPSHQAASDLRLADDTATGVGTKKCDIFKYQCTIKLMTF